MFKILILFQGIIKLCKKFMIKKKKLLKTQFILMENFCFLTKSNGKNFIIIQKKTFLNLIAANRRIIE